MSIAPSIPKSAIVLPSNVKVVNTSGTLILQKVKRRVKRFKMSKKQRQKIAASARKFKLPILTAVSIGPATLLAAQAGLAQGPLINKIQVFLLELLSYYTGLRIAPTGQFLGWQGQRMLVGWGPIVAVGAAKAVAKGRIMAINRALSRAQIPANLS